MPASGHCLCGAIRYELDAELGALVNCHCRFCRRAHGAAFATTTPVARRALRITAGADAIREYETPAGARAFCGRCGSRLYNRPKSQPILALVVASLDPEPQTPPAAHLNVGSKAPWYEILDQAPRFEAFPPGVDDAMARIAGDPPGDPA